MSDLGDIRARSDHFTVRDGEVVPADETTPLERLFRTREDAEAQIPRCPICHDRAGHSLSCPSRWSR